MNMKTSRRRGLCGAAALAMLIGAAGIASAADPQPGTVEAGDVDLTVKQNNGVPFVTGGVGDEEQDALRAMDAKFNLRIHLATTDGKSLGAGSVRIEDQQGRTVVDAPTNGPIFLAKLPAGPNRVHAVAGGRSASRSATVPSVGQEEVTLTWPGSADLDDSEAGDAPALDRAAP
jgi:hypothetical protein